MSEPPEHRWVSNAELKAELDAIREDIRERPTRWETRYLVAIAVAGTVLIPQIDIARNSAATVIGWLW